jgi:hypothetical protein
MLTGTFKKTLDGHRASPWYRAWAMVHKYTRIEATHRIAFRCPRCDHQAIAISSGDTQLAGHGWSSDALERAARHHLERQVLLAPCPGCRRRAPRALWRLAARSLALALPILVVVLGVFWMLGGGGLRRLDYAGALSVTAIVALVLFIRSVVVANHGVFFDSEEPSITR